MNGCHVGRQALCALLVHGAGGGVAQEGSHRLCRRTTPRIVPELSQNRSKIVPESFQNRPRIIQDSSQNHAKLVPANKTAQNRPRIVPELIQNCPRITPQSLELCTCARTRTNADTSGKPCMNVHPRRPTKQSTPIIFVRPEDDHSVFNRFRRGPTRAYLLIVFVEHALIVFDAPLIVFAGG